MAAVVTQTGNFVGEQTGPLLSAKGVATAIPATGNTDILEFRTLGLKNIGVTILPTVRNLDGFIVSVKLHPDGAFVSLYTAITSTPAGLIIAASGTLASLAADATGWFTMDVRGIYAVKISVSVTGGDDGAITVLASGSR